MSHLYKDASELPPLKEPEPIGAFASNPNSEKVVIEAIHETEEPEFECKIC